MAAAKSRRSADGLAGSVARARTPGARAGQRNRSALARLSSREGLIHPSEPGQASVFEPPRAVRNRAWWWTRSKQQPWKRKFAASDFRQDAPGIALRIAGPTTETGPWRGKLRKCRAILWRRKSRRFARTTWWRTQSPQKGLRRADFPVYQGNLPLLRF